MKQEKLFIDTSRSQTTEGYVNAITPVSYTHLAKIIIVGWDYEEAVTFPDNSKEYLKSFNETIKYGSFDDIEIKAPLIDMTKEDIVKKGHEVNAPMNISYSCYVGCDTHCGVCESCKRRKRAVSYTHLIEMKYEGIMLDHLFIGANMIENRIKKIDAPKKIKIQLIHMILSNHGDTSLG